MKKLIALVAVLASMAFSSNAQNQGRFETRDMGSFKLHVYYTGDALGDASYIIEGRKGLVTLEQPLFKVNVAEYDAYLASLKKPVVKRITDYHVGGTGANEVVMPSGMPAFVKGDIYGGMMKGFASTFGDSMTDLPTGKTSEVAFGKKVKWAGVPFVFNHGAASDFPGASIIIGKKVYYTHWAPSKSHPSALQVSSRAAVDGELAEARKALASGCKVFIGGHGGAATLDDVKFKVEYLEKVKANLSLSKDDFVKTMKNAYPSIPGDLQALADALYK